VLSKYILKISLISTSLTLFLCSCSNSKVSVPSPDNTLASTTSSAKETSTPVQTPMVTDNRVPTIVNIGSEQYKFFSSDDFKVKSNLVSDQTPNDLKFPFHVTGEYDLDLDNKMDKIRVTLVEGGGEEKSKLQINDKILELYSDIPREVYLMDFDSNDKYIEVVVADDGPSDDPELCFFRYTGNEILELGNIHEEVLMDGLGKAVSTFQMTNFEPKFASGFYEITDNKLITRSAKFSQALNKEFTVPKEMEAFFKEMDSVPEDYMPDFSEEAKTITLHMGEKIKVKKINENDGVVYWYEVELANGKNGVLYFWMGD